jgi:hypothetical protein
MKITEVKRARGMAEVVEHLPSKLKTPRSNPSHIKGRIFSKIKVDNKVYYCVPIKTQYYRYLASPISSIFPFSLKDYLKQIPDIISFYL